MSGRDRGQAAVLVLMLATVLFVSMSAALVEIGGRVIDRTRAQTAADAAALGAIIGDSSKSAKRGAVAGGLIGGVRQSSANRQTEQKQQEWAQRESSNYANSRNNYNRAYGACLEGRGYTVK